MKIINVETKKMIPLKNKKYESYLNQTITFAKRSSKLTTLIIKTIKKLGNIAIITELFLKGIN